MEPPERDEAVKPDDLEAARTNLISGLERSRAIVEDYRRTLAGLQRTAQTPAFEGDMRRSRQMQRDQR